MKINKDFQLPRAGLLRSVRFTRLLLLISIGFVPACHSPSPDKGKTVFHYNEFGGIASLDPALAKNLSIMWAIHQLYNTLVETDNDLRIVPSLASSWEISSDKLIYTFHLRTDVWFHDDEAFAGGKGRRMTARDVVYSFARIMDRNTASSGACT